MRTLTIGDVEKEIHSLEKFNVTILHLTGANVRSDLEINVAYGYEKAAYNDWSVTEWIDGRFKQRYPGFDVVVLFGFDVVVLLKDGSKAAGNMKLKNVRTTYL